MPTGNHTPHTPRTARTRGWIVEAFNRLVLSRRYDKFGVAEIAGRAGVGRSTFYEHFRDKDDLLRLAAAAILKPLAAAVGPQSDPAKIQAVIEHIAANRAATLAMLDGGPGGPGLERTLAALIQEQLPAPAQSPPHIPASLLARQIASAQLGLLRAWLRPIPPPCPPGLLAESLQRTSRAIAAAG